MKEASFVSIENGKEFQKKIMEKENDDDNTNTMTSNLFNQSNNRVESLLDSNKTVGLDEIMNLLKN